MEPISNFEMQEKLLQHYEQITKQTLEDARMELRDRFAMAALSGFASRGISQFTMDAQYCYKIADEMIKVRSEK